MGGSLSQGHQALHHSGMMGSSCLCQPVSQPGTALACLANITLTERREGGTSNPCCLVTGTKWCLPFRVLTPERAESQDTSELSWRMGRQLSSVTRSTDLEDHRLLHTQSLRKRSGHCSHTFRCVPLLMLLFYFLFSTPILV